jgi:GNAT superfamily N-acetyltransferase
MALGAGVQELKKACRVSDTSIRMAHDDRDFEVARALCREWLEWHWKVFPGDGPRENNPLDPEAFQSVIDDLPQIHARPRGGILLAEVNDRPAGCVMYHELEPDVAEVKRLFVNEAGRGHGLGRLLMEQMFEQMIEDGYRTVMFSSAKFLTHARSLYESVGFRDIPHPESFPDHLHSFVYFMERPLLKEA